MVRALTAGRRRGFCALRPAGHHAESDRAMGFCLFNNVAIAAELAIREQGVEKVMIIDWDVHHGNGTAEIFRHRPDVLVAASIRSGLFPGHRGARRRRIGRRPGLHGQPPRPAGLGRGGMAVSGRVPPRAHRARLPARAVAHLGRL